MTGADAKPQPGLLNKGKQGASRSAGSGAINWIETLLRGRPRQREDVVYRTRKSAAQTLWLVVVDASASTRRHQALSDAKGLLAQVFEDAYRQRARVAVMTASGSTPEWQVSGAKASKALEQWLATLGAGGGTPLLAALQEASKWLSARDKQWPEEQKRFLLLTDGRVKEWLGLSRIECPGVLIDIERGPIRLGRAQQLASALEVDYLHIDQLQQR